MPADIKKTGGYRHPSFLNREETGELSRLTIHNFYFSSPSVNIQNQQVGNPISQQLPISPFTNRQYQISIKMCVVRQKISDAETVIILDKKRPGKFPIWNLDFGDNLGEQSSSQIINIDS